MMILVILIHVIHLLQKLYNLLLIDWINNIMTQEEHQTRHNLLHQHLDELVGDYIDQHSETNPSKITVFELINWSAKQKNEVDHTLGYTVIKKPRI